MKLINFDIADDNIALIFKGQYLDIHNNYEFCGYYRDSELKEVRLRWTRSHEDWSNEEICGFELLFKNVNYLRIRERDDTLPKTEDSCLSFIGFLPQEDREIFDSYIVGNNTKDTNDLIVNFMSEQAFKINADVVEFSELNEEIIYVPVEVGYEGNKTWKPIWAEKIDELTYRIKSYCSNYNLINENLLFKLNEIVICEKRKLPMGQYLVAIKKK